MALPQTLRNAQEVWERDYAPIDEMLVCARRLLRLITFADNLTRNRYAQTLVNYDVI